ncbi:hypothetical protein BRL53_09055 [Corynebacterium ulcerans]|nr:hypothetical protein BRL53_09055 [Corynebacterium ulcerans]
MGKWHAPNASVPTHPVDSQPSQETGFVERMQQNATPNNGAPYPQNGLVAGQNITAGARQSPIGEPRTATSAQAINAHHTQQQTSPQNTSHPSRTNSTEVAH